MLDGAGVLLLRVSGFLHAGVGRKTRWLAVSNADAGTAMHALRVALYAAPAESTGAVDAERSAGA
ncbi:MAG: hypothetical protein H7Z19_17580 [Chitinophagaceae bacterium]|nr:hypothetical protein [Rubrivivax sp.]